MLSERADASSFRRDPQAEFSARRAAMRKFQYPGNATPKLQEMSSALREGGTDQEADADQIDQESAQIADESNAAENMSLAARARSRAKAAADDGMQKMMDMAKKEAQKMAPELATQGTAFGLSAGGQGEDLEMADLTGIAISVARVVVTVLPPSDEKLKFALEKFGLSPIKMGKIIPIGELSIAGFATQVAAFVGKCTIVASLLIFIVFAYGSIINNFGTVASNTLQILLP